MRELLKGTLRRLGLLEPAKALRGRLCGTRAAKLISWALWHLDLLRRNAPYWFRGAPDGLPVPPLYLRRLIYQGYFDYTEHFLKAWEAAWVLDILAKNGVNLQELQSILDFGCGCGRVLRQFPALQHRVPRAKLSATDYNPRLIAWCRRRLTFAECAVNQLGPPLAYPAERFDFVFAISIFSHLPEDLQFAWMRELTRVLKPGGYLLITTHGETCLRRHQASPDVRERFRGGEMMVFNGAAAGTNVCYTYHPVAYVQTKLAGELQVLDFVPGELWQDAHLFRKPAQVAALTSGKQRSVSPGDAKPLAA